MKFLNEIFNFVVFIQFVFLMVFLALNLDTLNEIEYTITIEAFVYTFTVNLYYATAIVVVVYITVIIIQSAFPLSSEESQRNISKLLGFVMFFTTMSVGFNFYVDDLGTFGSIIEFFVAIIYFIKSMDSISKSDSVE